MPRASRAQKTLPATTIEQLEKLGRDIVVARKRRRMSMTEMADRMKVNVKTVQRLEKGDPAVSIGIVVTALWVLGLHRRLGEVASPEGDRTGLQEDIDRLPRDFRKPREPHDMLDF